MKHAKKSQRALWLFASFAALAISILITAIALFHISRSRTFQFFGGLTYRVETDKKLVALTFDDGPTEKADEILSVLEKTNTKATFFVIGQEIERQPEELSKLVAAGHEIGNHSYSHQRNVLKTPSFIAHEIDRTNELIRQASYSREIHFRPPYSKKLFVLPYELKKRNMKTIMVDVEPESYPEVAISRDAIIDHVLKNTRPGSIILLHPWYTNQQSRDAIGPIVEKLRAQGYEFVTVTDLLKEKN